MQILPVSFSRYPKDHVFPLLTMQNTRNEDSEIETDAKNKGNKDDVFAWRERFVICFILLLLDLRMEKWQAGEDSQLVFPDQRARGNGVT